MEQTEMKEKLIEREKEIRAELLELERQFNLKKEEFLKVQGALEALSLLETGPQSTSEGTPES